MTSSARDTGFLDRSVKAGGETYRYQVHVPAGWDKHRKWPVILFLHGAGERGSDGLAQTQIGVPAAVRKRPADIPAVVVMPQCREGKTWSSPDMQAQALKALDQSIREFKGDKDRVYAAGLSMGGYGVWELALARPRRFAAYIVVCGGVRSPNGYPDILLSLAKDPKVADPYAELARRVGKTPVWMFHGDADTVVPVDESRKIHAALKALGGDAKYAEYPGVGHGSWDNAFAEPELFKWLLAQRLKR